MYLEGASVHEHHVRTYGHPSEYGYKEVARDWATAGTPTR